MVGEEVPESMKMDVRILGPPAARSCNCPGKEGMPRKKVHALMLVAFAPNLVDQSCSWEAVAEDNYRKMKVDTGSFEKDMSLSVDNHNQSIVHDANHEVPIVEQRAHVEDDPAGCIHQIEVKTSWSK
ncbi:D-tyrosyl-tRNA(Tyr) deacylase [Striga asiatica]|uniref:D-tyrosyl-tRNA(Tyr) deacylase n=1 Tax=Striga asiatica TaxID=4170 RepID=A0A5A7PYC3_STRAF|nr:D-tyrosyl-tRNA(Tyr) deacylase [Striga asiatica]